MNRWFSVMSVFAIFGAVLYLGAFASLLYIAVLDGSATLKFDLLEPVELFVFFPSIIVILFATALREMRRLAEK